MKWRVRHSAPPPSSEPPVLPAPSSSLGSSESSTPTRVTPSMSFSAVTKPATDSWPGGTAGNGKSRTWHRWAQVPAATAAFAGCAIGGSGGVEFGQPDVLRKDQREFAHHPLPVEATVGKAGDRRHPLFVQGLELRIGDKAFGFPHGDGVFALQLCDFDLPFVDLVAGDDQEGDAGEYSDKRTDDDVGDRAGPHRRAGALAQLRGEEGLPVASQLSRPRPRGRTRRAARASSRPERAGGRGAVIGKPTCSSIAAPSPGMALPAPQRTTPETGTALSSAR